jgi:hypothetical protein
MIATQGRLSLKQRRNFHTSLNSRAYSATACIPCKQLGSVGLVDGDTRGKLLVSYSLGLKATVPQRISHALTPTLSEFEAEYDNCVPALWVENKLHANRITPSSLSKK